MRTRLSAGFLTSPAQIGRGSGFAATDGTMSFCVDYVRIACPWAIWSVVVHLSELSSRLGQEERVRSSRIFGGPRSLFTPRVYKLWYRYRGLTLTVMRRPMLTVVALRGGFPYWV